MDKITLGTQGLRVSKIGLGGMGFSVAYGASDPQKGVDVIREAYHLGVNFFDTAEVYGDNEKIVGKAVKSFRDDIVLATKFGFDMSAKPITSKFNSRPDNIRKVAENSLLQLGTDYIDVFYQHIPDPDVPIEEVAGVVGDLIKEGKVKYFGLSNSGSDSIRRANKITPVSVLQSEYSIFERELEDRHIIETLQELNIGLVPYAPLGRGFLTDAVKPAKDYPKDDMRRHDERWNEENFKYNLNAVNQLKAFAENKHISVAQLALAWLMNQDLNVVPIPGTRSIKRLQENIGSTQVKLSRQDLDDILAILPNGSAGSRYPAGVLENFTRE